MLETLVHRIKEVTLKDPILIEGLPGVGHVGKLVADHMVEELHAEKIIEIYSPHFPPQVMVKEDGTIRQVR
ncbi:MAG: proteasome assembly chaperone family protein, partial [Methanothrix sp.]